MRKTIVITDLTQMPRGNEVCVVGIDPEGRCIRPVCEGGFLKQHLYDTEQKVLVRHGSKVEFDLSPIDTLLPPHIEDMSFDPTSITGKGLCSDSEWEDTLLNNSYTVVGEIYDGLLEERKWVKPGANTRSIATLSGASIVNVQLPEWDGKLRYRLSFKDRTGNLFDCPVSDLTFRELCYKRIKRDSHPRLPVAGELSTLLKNADRVYLRLGLARPFRTSPTTEPRCYLQVTGIHTFPDYLQGKTFADFLT
ncbi:MAG: hypothetical protein KAT53_04940 [Dehalococcoidia bacterium]|nr:hypothetical protein [Dehalococcoidia bacterium]